jgi:hypothetical protein
MMKEISNGPWTMSSLCGTRFRMIFRQKSCALMPKKSSNSLRELPTFVSARWKRPVRSNNVHF